MKIFIKLLRRIELLKNSGIGSAPGKVILSGEHSVVYKQPAIAVALDLRCKVTLTHASPGLRIISPALDLDVYYKPGEKDLAIDFDGIHRICHELIPDALNHQLEISSDIPISAGLGSSAALAVATVAAIADMYEIGLTEGEISNLAFTSEIVIHGTPSGIDNSIATWGGALIFEDGNITRINPPSIPLVVINSKIPRNTKKLVAEVANLKSQIKGISDVIKIMGIVTRQIIQSLEKADIEKLGKLMDVNQGLLDTIGVGHQILSDTIWKMRDAGIIGAKLTGAGGGGCMIGIVNDQNALGQLREQGLELIETRTSSIGVIIGEGPQ